MILERIKKNTVYLCGDYDIDLLNCDRCKLVHIVYAAGLYNCKQSIIFSDIIKFKCLAFLHIKGLKHKELNYLEVLGKYQSKSLTLKVVLK